MSLLGHSATSCLGTVAGNTSDFVMSATATDIHCSHVFHERVSRHVRFGLPHLLHPPSGVQSITRLADLDVGRRSTCPMNLLRLVATMSCRSPMLALSRFFVLAYLMQQKGKRYHTQLWEYRQVLISLSLALSILLSLWRIAIASSELRSPSQPHSITAIWLVPSHTAWWQRQTH